MKDLPVNLDKNDDSVHHHSSMGKMIKTRILLGDKKVAYTQSYS
mgnify:CR=1 FL=1